MSSETQHKIKIAGVGDKTIDSMRDYAVSEWGSCSDLRQKAYWEGIQYFWDSYTSTYPKNVSFNKFKQMLLCNLCFCGKACEIPKLNSWSVA